MGTHAAELDFDDNSRGILWLLIGQFIIAVAIGIRKCAVAIFLIRIVTKTLHKILLYFWILSILFLSFLLAIAVFVQCTPLESFWDSRIEGTCTLSLIVIAKVMCSWSAAMDFFLAVFPRAVIWGINMKRKENITICVSLSLGIIAGICGVVRTTTLDSLGETDDYLYAVSDSVMWTMSQRCATIICVIISTLRPLYNRLTGRSSADGPYQNYGCDNRKSFGGNGAGGEYNMKSVKRGKKDPTLYDMEITRGGPDTNSDSDTHILSQWLHDQKMQALAAYARFRLLMKMSKARLVVNNTSR
ncbi:12f2fe9d-2b1d-4ace-a64e-12429fad1989 [Sclerotinia trifoliorum]|uniref:12f2fe9d-2b1d-4ace-a64e-12429fad1989 n=1 Tax=Sclerotinia trifoliorum TaxID=28548 RepID=A0A8H2VX79_9HELO|nr:12f2fe9d-2b1d-4ace-a64e-12429fad1989 [Sclerotinia trifoliorum]